MDALTKGSILWLVQIKIFLFAAGFATEDETAEIKRVYGKKTSIRSSYSSCLSCLRSICSKTDDHTPDYQLASPPQDSRDIGCSAVTGKDSGDISKLDEDSFQV